MAQPLRGALPGSHARQRGAVRPRGDARVAGSILCGGRPTVRPVFGQVDRVLGRRACPRQGMLRLRRPRQDDGCRSPTVDRTLLWAAGPSTRRHPWRCGECPCKTCALLDPYPPTYSLPLLTHVSTLHTAQGAISTIATRKPTGVVSAHTSSSLSSMQRSAAWLVGRSTPRPPISPPLSRRLQSAFERWRARRDWWLNGGILFYSRGTYRSARRSTSSRVRSAFAAAAGLAPRASMTSLP